MNRNVFNLLQSIYHIFLTMYLIILMQLNNKLRCQSFANEKDSNYFFCQLPSIFCSQFLLHFSFSYISLTEVLLYYSP